MFSNADVLAQVPLFQTLTPDELTIVATWFREDGFAPETFLFHEGDVSARFWVLKTGQIKIIKYGEGGKEIVVEMISPGEVFGGASMLMPRQPATAQTFSDVTTISLAIDEYKRLLHNYPAVAVQVIEMLGARMAGFIRMRAMAGEKVERRIAHMLLKLATKFGEPTEEGMLIRASLTRQDIAELTDTTVETAIRVMSHLSKEGVIKTLRGGYIVILKQTALETLRGQV